MSQIKERIKDKKEKLKTIFRIVQKHGPIERKQIQKMSKLSWGSVSEYSASLIGSSIMKQSLALAWNVGKTPLILDINDQDNYIVGVDFNFIFIRVVVLDLKGRLIKTRMAPVTDGSRVVDILLSTLEAIISEFAPDKCLIAISISVQGNLDEERGIALYLSFEPTWRNLKLKEIVENRFGIPTFTFHDPDCVLVAEKYFGNAMKEEYVNVVTIIMNLGIGMSLMTNSKLYNSTSGHHGELGHITVVEGGALCSCGKRGCLEAYASRTGILNRFIDAVNEGKTSLASRDDVFSITYDTVRDGANAGDSICLEIFRNAGRILGNTIASLATMLDPDAIIIFGELAHDRNLFEDMMMDNYNANVYPGNETKVVFSDQGASAPVLGAAMYAIEKIIGNFLFEKTKQYESQKNWANEDSMVQNA
ncbi:MAG: ROK family protein [Synergistaceae bacterium]|jgi:predicted NBD/HSP70 family sugar kinase|nr:ROK family protein [Synergistaceae bacterium]